jgi:hypothetical protein
MMLALLESSPAGVRTIGEATPKQARRRDNDMALSIADLELQTAEFLPAREVMGGKHGKRDCGCEIGRAHV